MGASGKVELGPEERLNARRQRLEAVLLAAAPAVWDWDLETRTFLASDGLALLFGAASAAALDLDSFLAAIHPDDRASWRRMLDTAWLPQRLEFRIHRLDSGETRWLSTEIVGSSTEGRAKGLTGTVGDISGERRISLELMESNERLRIAIEAGRMAIWEVDMGTGKLTNSPELNRLLGLPDDAQPTLDDVRRMYAPGTLERLARAGVTYESVRARTRLGPRSRRPWEPIPAASRTELHAEFTLIMPDGTPKELMFRAQYAPAVEDYGQRITGLLIDITDRKRAEEQQLLVAREMQHRVKNSLAVVQAIAAQTFRADIGKDEAAKVFFGRLGALAAATDALLSGDASATDLATLLGRVLTPFRSERADSLEVEGPPVSLAASQASNLGLAVHELATNAVKYGALSVPEGRVTLGWTVAGDTVTLDWRESGGPTVTRPARKGFGSRLLATAFPADALELDYRPEGFACRLRFAAEPA